MAQAPVLDDALRKEYQNLFDTCSIKPSKISIVESKAQEIVEHAAGYMDVAEKIGMPWWIVGLIHMMESNCNFRTHLHNGDPLTARTVRVPKGRPLSGSPPFSWVESAVDAMQFKGFDKIDAWDVPQMLYLLEGYNGWGYRMYHSDVKSPYLWSMSQHYVSGKYVSDGKWSQSAVSEQCGAAVIMKRMSDNGMICISCLVDDLSDASDNLLISKYSSSSQSQSEIEKAKHLQRWLNTFDDIELVVDGHPGPATSNAYRLVTGHYLPGDPRGE